MASRVVARSPISGHAAEGRRSQGLTGALARSALPRVSWRATQRHRSTSVVAAAASGPGSSVDGSSVDGAGTPTATPTLTPGGGSAGRSLSMPAVRVVECLPARGEGVPPDRVDTNPGTGTLGMTNGRWGAAEDGRPFAERAQHQVPTRCQVRVRV